jgi:hypothetical protein
VPRGNEPRLAGNRGRGQGHGTLDDFEHADTLLFGQNPPPTTRACWANCAKPRRGATIVSINPLRERGLERFTSPQHPLEMLTGSTNISSLFISPTLAATSR